MGTRSVIAIPLDGGFKGRYAHWDGYPTHMAAELHAIVRRDGVERARQVLTQDNASWSSIDHEEPNGYGRAHGDISAEEFDTYWITSGGDDNGTEWAYVLNDQALSVFQRTDEDGNGAVGMFGMSAAEDGSWKHVGDLPYDQDLDHLQLRSMEMGEADEETTGALASGF